MEILPYYFFITMIITLIILYIMYPEPEIIIKEKKPTINEAISKMYIDDNDICYKYHRNETECNK